MKIVRCLVFLLLTMAVWDTRAQQAGVGRRFDVATPATNDVVSMAISPDGRMLVFVATENHRNHLRVCRIDDEESKAPSFLLSIPSCAAGGRPLPGTDYASE